MGSSCCRLLAVPVRCDLPSGTMDERVHHHRLSGVTRFTRLAATVCQRASLSYWPAALHATFDLNQGSECLSHPVILIGMPNWMRTASPILNEDGIPSILASIHPLYFNRMYVPSLNSQSNGCLLINLMIRS